MASPKPQSWNTLLFNTENVLALVSLAVLAAAATTSQLSWWMTALAVGCLAAAISASVHNAEVIAQRVGPSRGTIVLALSVTVIEVALIVSMMGSGRADAATVARDTVFAAFMIVTNGILGVCILLGGLKHKSLSFQTMGTTSLLGVLVVLVGFTLILPNFTSSTPGATYSHTQLLFVSVTAILLHGGLVWSQTTAHRSYFEAIDVSRKHELEAERYVPTNAKAIASFIGLIFSLVAVVGLAKVLSPTISILLAAAGAPPSTVGIVIALLVLAPETLAAVQAARRGQLQTSLNLAIGSGVASIALTIPAVSLYSIVAAKPLTLGLDSKGIAFSAITFLSAGLTFSSGQTTALQGLVHLALLGGYLVLSFVP